MNWESNSLNCSIFHCGQSYQMPFGGETLSCYLLNPYQNPNVKTWVMGLSSDACKILIDNFLKSYF